MRAVVAMRCRYRRRTWPSWPRNRVSSAPSRNNDVEGRTASDRQHPAALTRHEAEIERADSRGCSVQDAEAVPARRVTAPTISCQLGGVRENGRAISTRQGALADDDHRVLGGLQRFGEVVLAGDEFGQGFGAGTEIFVGVAQCRRLRRSRAIGRPPRPPALADAGVENRGFIARARTNDQDRVGLLRCLQCRH